MRHVDVVGVGMCQRPDPDGCPSSLLQVMKSIGNVASNAKYNPDEARHPLPANLEESERDSELEKFIRGMFSSEPLSWGLCVSLLSRLTKSFWDGVVCL